MWSTNAPAQRAAGACLAIAMLQVPEDAYNLFGHYRSGFAGKHTFSAAAADDGHQA